MEMAEFSIDCQEEESVSKPQEYVLICCAVLDNIYSLIIKYAIHSTVMNPYDTW